MILQINLCVMDSEKRFDRHEVEVWCTMDTRGLGGQIVGLRELRVRDVRES